MAETSPTKDNWDKWEIIGKVAGAVVVPVMIGVTASWLNGQSIDRQTAARMTEIAIGILQSEKQDHIGDGALRDWAILVLQRPTSPPELSDEAADELRSDGLPAITLNGYGNVSEAQKQAVADAFARALGEKLGQSALDNLNGARPLGEDLLPNPVERNPGSKD